MRRLFIIGGVLAALVLLPAGWAMAEEDHTSCAGFGEATTRLAQTGGQGIVASMEARRRPGAMVVYIEREQDRYCSH